MTAIDRGVRLARIDVTRMRRKHTDWSGGVGNLISLAMYVLLLGTATLGGGYLGFRAGELLASGDLPIDEVGPFAAMEVVRGILALFWLLLVVIFLIRAVGQRGTLAQPEGVLTVVTTDQALIGVVLAEWTYFLLWLLPPAASVGAGLALGSGVAWPALAVPLAVAAAGIACVGVGYPLGLGIRHLATRFPFVVRHKGAIVAAVFLAYFVALSSGAWDDLMVTLFEPMQQSPVGWYADLSLLGVPTLAASTARAAGALALTGALGVLGVAAGTVLARRHWFSDPALAGEAAPETGSTEAAEAAEPGVERRLEPYLGTATASLVALSWRRALRSPIRLLYAFYPMLFLAGLFAEIVQTGDVPAYLPYAILLCATWSAGVIFTLNPLGDQGAALASTLLSDVDGRTFVRAHVVAGLVVAVPIATVATAAVAVVSPIDAESVLLLVAGTPVVMVVAAMLSVGIGMAFPRFEATEVTRSMKTVLPSRWAFVLFTAHLFATAAAAVIVAEPVARELGAGLLSWALPFGLSVAAGELYWIAAVALVPLVIAAPVAYRYAVRRFDRYTIA